MDRPVQPESPLLAIDLHVADFSSPLLLSARRFATATAWSPRGCTKFLALRYHAPARRP
jgi:hypothetical protein